MAVDNPGLEVVKAASIRSFSRSLSIWPKVSVFPANFKVAKPDIHPSENFNRYCKQVLLSDH